MARLSFLGAFGTVTGSKSLLAAGSRRLPVDCSAFQGFVGSQATGTLGLTILKGRAALRDRYGWNVSLRADGEEVELR